MDATGLETTTTSAHFQSRSGRQRRKWVKVSTIILWGSLLPLGLVLDWGPGNDKCQAQALIAKASNTNCSLRLHYFGDAGKEGHAETIPPESARFGAGRSR
jgi:hypothetical protein